MKDKNNNFIKKLFCIPLLLIVAFGFTGCTSPITSHKNTIKTYIVKYGKSLKIGMSYTNLENNFSSAKSKRSSIISELKYYE
jgi:hypothetical protein